MNNKRNRYHLQRAGIAFDDWYNDMSADWETKAQRLQVRRWHALEREAGARTASDGSENQ